MARWPHVYADPPDEARDYAALALEVRARAPKSKRWGLTTQEAGRQGIGSGVARARDIKAGKRVNAAQVRAYFNRHERHYLAAMERARASDLPLEVFAEREPAIQGWWGWGGNPMREAAEAAYQAFQLEQEEQARRSANPRTGTPAIGTDLVLLDPPPTIDLQRVARIADAMTSSGGWGDLPPVLGWVETVSAAQARRHRPGREGPLVHLPWTRAPRPGDRYLHLTGGGTHRALAAVQTGSVLHYMLAFERSTQAADVRALVRRVTRGWNR